MDDSRFDDIIKRKVSEYEAPGFDGAALDAFHRQMASMQPSSWYARHRTELVTIGALALSTMVILLSLWSFTTERRTASEKSAALIELQQQQIANLTRQLDDLNNNAADTIYIQHQSPAVETLQEKIAGLEWIIKDLSARAAFRPPSEQAMEISPQTALRPAVFYSSERSPVTVRFSASPLVRPQQDNHGRNHIVAGRHSLKTHRELENHYHKGVGIRTGPVVNLSKGMYAAGAGRVDFSGGLISDFILSPWISIETGAKFTHRFYEMGQNEITSRATQLPEINSALGPVESADVDSWSLEIPVNLKYRFPLSPKAYGLAGVGYAQTFITKQIFEYDYWLDGNSAVRVNESHTYGKESIHPGMLNIFMGLSHRLRNNKSVETSLFYQHGLAPFGRESMRANFLGFRTAYWFTVR